MTQSCNHHSGSHDYCAWKQWHETAHYGRRSILHAHSCYPFPCTLSTLYFYFPTFLCNFSSWSIFTAFGNLRHSDTHLFTSDTPRSRLRPRYPQRCAFQAAIRLLDQLCIPFSVDFLYDFLFSFIFPVYLSSIILWSVCDDWAPSVFYSFLPFSLFIVPLVLFLFPLSFLFLSSRAVKSIQEAQ